jgi:hypothetical protein
VTDTLDDLLANAADDLSRGVIAPPADRLLARARRRRVLRIALPAVVAPVLAAAVATAIGLGPSLLLHPGPEASSTEYATDGPELGHVPLPSSPLPPAPPGSQVDPPTNRAGDLLAIATTKNGRARLVGFQRRSGARCVVQDYAVPFWNSNGPSQCGQDGQVPFDERPLVVSGTAVVTPGSVKPAPLAFGAAPPGTRTVEFSAPGRATVRAEARDGGPDYKHRAFFITSWPMGVASTFRALDANDRELAREHRRGQLPEEAQRACESASGILLSHLQRAAMVGEKWAHTHPQTADPARFQVPSGVANGSAWRTADETDALKRLHLANAEASRLGPEEKYEYRLAAVLIVGDGRTCFKPALQSQASELLENTR